MTKIKRDFEYHHICHPTPKDPLGGPVMWDPDPFFFLLTFYFLLIQDLGYKDLIIWQKSIVLNRKIYEITKKFPKEEKFGIISQIRRSAVSVPSNIAEGYGRMSNKSFSSFLKISLGSLYELETQLVISKNEGFYQEGKDLNDLVLEIKRMIYSLINKINFFLLSSYFLLKSLKRIFRPSNFKVNMRSC